MPPAPPPPPAYQQDSRGVLALVLGIVGVVVTSLAAPFAWWLGASERRDIAAGRRPANGQGFATAGMVLGIVGTILLAIGAVSALVAIVVALVFGLSAIPFLAALDEGELDVFVDLGTTTAVDWEDAAPRGSADDDGIAPDRCDLQSWFEDQLDVGMTTDELRDAVGSPDGLEIDGGQEVWSWDLGTCSVDAEVYELEIVDGELQEWRVVDG